MTSMRPEDLRSRRARAGLTIKELGNRSGISEATIGRIENGYTRATERTLAQLERALDDPCRELLEAAKEARDELEQYQARWMEALAEKLDAAIRKAESGASR